MDAILGLTSFVENSPEKHIIANIKHIMDISGAFDNIWWPAIFASLREANISKKIYQLKESYLSQRKVFIEEGGAQVEREVNRGCPQGSVLGPILWNLIFNDLLKAQFPERESIIAFADNAVVLVPGQSRQSIEQKFKTIIDIRGPKRSN